MTAPPNSATTMSVPPIALMNSSWRSNVASVCSCMSLIVKYVLTHGSETLQSAQLERALEDMESVGYLWPMLQP